MRRCYRSFIPWLVLAALIQAAWAPALALQGLSPAPLAVEICSAEGLKRITLPLDEQGEKAPGRHGICLLCPGLPDLPPLPAPEAAPLRWAGGGAAPLPRAELPLAGGRRAVPQQPRAPPVAG
ncbi:MAG: hypothetical protein RMK64_08925 [Rhodovarius sp.]|nr:hypothetical protein [Rhodovarius sp.]MCX7931236.1 hypothetical protein [Rhodovarius sp.]MDW8315078.1 hypothetical protein [Rhodovarius sp.]